MSKDQMDALRSEKGGFTRAALASAGVPWPPPRNWKLGMQMLYEERRRAQSASGRDGGREG